MTPRQKLILFVLGLAAVSICAVAFVLTMNLARRMSASSGIVGASHMKKFVSVPVVKGSSGSQALRGTFPVPGPPTFGLFRGFFPQPLPTPFVASFAIFVFPIFEPSISRRVPFLVWLIIPRSLNYSTSVMVLPNTLDIDYKLSSCLVSKARQLSLSSVVNL